MASASTLQDATQVAQAPGTSPELQDEAEAVTCVLCQTSVEPDKAKGRTRNGKFSCRACETLKQLVHRNLGPDALDDFTPEYKQQFFKKTL